MNIQIGMNCEYEVICEYVNYAFGFIFAGLVVSFVCYLIYKSIKDK